MCHLIYTVPPLSLTQFLPATNKRDQFHVLLRGPINENERPKLTKKNTRNKLWLSREEDAWQVYKRLV